MPPTTTTTKAQHQEIHAHVIVGRVDRRVHDARKTCDGCGKAEHDGETAIDVDAQQADRLTVCHACAHHHAECGELQEGKHQPDNQRGKREVHQPPVRIDDGVLCVKPDQNTEIE